MIPDEAEAQEVDFSWFYFIGKTRLGLTFKETGRLTIKLFNRLYQHYKDNWDLEMRLSKANKTYAEIHAKAQNAEEWF